MSLNDISAEQAFWEGVKKIRDAPLRERAEKLFQVVTNTTNQTPPTSFRTFIERSQPTEPEEP